MMPRRLWLWPLGLLALVIGYNGLRLGMERAAMTEAVVIDFYAERYLEDHRQAFGSEGALTDCIAVPGDLPRVWIELRCSPGNGSADFIYGADRDGRQIYAGRDTQSGRT